MELKESVYSVLVVSAFQKFNNTISSLLPCTRYSPVTFVSDVSSAQRTLLGKSFDIIIINTPLPDEFGVSFAMDLSRRCSSGMILLVKHEHYADINARVAPLGIITVSKPVQAQVLLETLLILCGTRERIKRLATKTVSFDEKIKEIRLVNRAKTLLISEEGLTEAEAHRQIEKTAMDRCVTKKVIADEIILKYSENNKKKGEEND